MLKLVAFLAGDTSLAGVLDESAPNSATFGTSNSGDSGTSGRSVAYTPTARLLDLLSPRNVIGRMLGGGGGDRGAGGDGGGGGGGGGGGVDRLQSLTSILPLLAEFGPSIRSFGLTLGSKLVAKVCEYVCIYVCISICMYKYMYVYIYVYI
ncbi:hypothetical protein B484DRAFT_35344 [Ochromonadaceae sp. CCMP2298]|nr:hypothetical protein B484DRAFT_35344 [Ochromonadaceae sp. CCMP2298]